MSYKCFCLTIALAAHDVFAFNKIQYVVSEGMFEETLERLVQGDNANQMRQKSKPLLASCGSPQGSKLHPASTLFVLVVAILGARRRRIRT